MSVCLVLPEVILPRIPPLRDVLRILRVRPTDLVRESKRVAPLLEARPISRGHLSRLKNGETDATSKKILVLTTALRSLTGLPIRASELFYLEPEEATASRAPNGLFSGLGSRMPELAQPSSLAERLDVLYGKHNALLCAIVTREGVPADEAPGLVNGVFASFLERRPKVDDERAFLIGAVRNAARHYRRKRRNESPLLPEHEKTGDLTTAESLERWTVRLALAEMLARLGTKCREALLRKCLHDDSYQGIAKRLELSPTYMSEFLASCKRRALAIYREITKCSL